MTMAFGRQLDCYMWASEGGTGQFLPVPEKDLFFLKKKKQITDIHTVRIRGISCHQP